MTAEAALPAVGWIQWPHGSADPCLVCGKYDPPYGFLYRPPRPAAAMFVCKPCASDLAATFLHASGLQASRVQQIQVPMLPLTDDITVTVTFMKGAAPEAADVIVSPEGATFQEEADLLTAASRALVAYTLAFQEAMRDEEPAPSGT